MSNVDFIEGVQTFNRAAGRTDDRFDPRAIALHMGMIAEEFAEMCSACGLQINADYLQNLGRVLKSGAFDHLVAKADRVELLDASVDIMVVSVGGMMAQGADVHAACNEVNRSNLAKLINGVAIKDENGKIQKPAGWQAPQLSKFVKAD